MNYTIEISQPHSLEDGEVEVYIKFLDQSEFVTTCYSLKGLGNMLAYSKSHLEINYLVGTSNMIIVEELSEEVITKAIQRIISHEDYWNLFTPCNEYAQVHAINASGS